MGCKTIRSSQHKLVDTLNTRFWSSDIIMQARPCGFAEYQKGQKWNEMNILWLSRADGSPCSFITLGVKAGGGSWAPGGGWMEPRRGPPLRQASGPAQKDLGSLSSTPLFIQFSQCSCSLRARSRWDVPLQRHPRQPRPCSLWLFFWTSDTWCGLPPNPEGSEQRLHCQDGPWSDTAPTTLSAAPRRCRSRGWSIWKVTGTFWLGEDGQRLERSAYRMWSCRGAVSAVLGWVKCPGRSWSLKTLKTRLCNSRAH